MSLALVLVIVFLGTLGQAIFGFGGGLIAIPLLSLIIGVRDGVTLALVLQLATGILLFRQRHHLNWRTSRSMILGLGVGTVVGTYLLSGAGETFLRLFLAGFIAAYLVGSRFPEVSFPYVTASKAGALLTGTAAGYLQGLLGSGGPPLLVYLRATLAERSKVRANLLLLLFISNAVRLPLSLYTDLFNAYVISVAVASIPGFIFAMILGERLHHAINEVYYRRSIEALLAISAISLIGVSV